MKREKNTAFLVSVRQKRETVRVYAVLAPSRDVALDQVKALAAQSVRIEIAGSLSRGMVRRLDLKLGEIRLL